MDVGGLCVWVFIWTTTSLSYLTRGEGPATLKNREWTMDPQIVGREVRASHSGGSVPKSAPFPSNYSPAPRGGCFMWQWHLILFTDLNFAVWASACVCVCVRARPCVWWGSTWVTGVGFEWQCARWGWIITCVTVCVREFKRLTLLLLLFEQLCVHTSSSSSPFF